MAQIRTYLSRNHPVLWLVLLLALPGQAISQNFGNLLTRPVGKSAAVFAPGLVSDGLNNRDFTISPSGDEIFYTIQSQRFLKSVIIHRKKTNGRWQQPEVASFSGTFRDLEAFFTPDGKSIFFSSDRPVDARDSTPDFDIWRVDRLAAGWGKPVHLGNKVNSAKNEFYPSVARSGNLYFTARLQQGRGEDIVVCRLINGVYGRPELLDTAVNTAGDEFNAFVDPAENFIIFSSYKGRADEQGGGDLYISIRGRDGHWLPAENMGPNINSAALDYCPFVSSDRQVLYFASNRQTLDASKAALSYGRLTALLASAGNTSDDIYRVDFSRFLHTKQ